MAKAPKEPKETESSKWLRKISKQAMDRYQTKYYPMERQFVRDIQGSQESMGERARDDAGVATEQAFAKEEPGLALGMARAGVDPSSGRGISTMSGMNEDKAQSKAAGLTAGTNNANNAYYQNLLSTIQTGKGEQAGVMQGAAQVADSTNRQAILDARAAAAAREARNQVFGTAAGYGLGGMMDRYKAGGAPGVNEAGMAPQQTGFGYSYGYNDTPAPAPGMMIPLGGG